MRVKTILALMAFAAPLAVVAGSASAFLDRPDRHKGWDRMSRIHCWHHHGSKCDGGDPYAYQYEPTGYYPYYNSGYWGPPRLQRYRGELPSFYASWGAWRRNYRHVDWHNENHGGHRRGNW